ncbi:MAG TPA: M23 family metallopeptidase [Sporichthyaceae bacterium]|nr:M23 family metallopeptidase [Sporichthyaceae bacterium]
MLLPTLFGPLIAAMTSLVAMPAADAAVPVGSATHYEFPLRCSGHVSYGHVHHDYPATDMFAPVGCTFLAPVAGTVDEISAADDWNSRSNKGADRGGRSVSIVGADGVRYYGSHLSALAPGIRPGTAVKAGQPLGAVGRSGDARGGSSHLHFGISWPTVPGRWWVRRGEVYPWPYLDAWRAHRDRSPATAVAARHRQVGDKGCTTDC